MTLEKLKDLCLSFPLVTIDYPFDETTLAFRIHRKIFALCPTAKTPLKINLKCDPALARDLRTTYPDIVPGWHMNKEHWNTVNLEGQLTDQMIHQLIQHSYELVKKKGKKGEFKNPFKP